VTLIGVTYWAEAAVTELQLTMGCQMANVANLINVTQISQFSRTSGISHKKILI
jgi:hypothetical protein